MVSHALLFRAKSIASPRPSNNISVMIQFGWKFGDRPKFLYVEAVVDLGWAWRIPLQNLYCTLL